MCGRYKDDVNFIVEAKSGEETTEVGEARDRRVMTRVKTIEDSIETCIKVEVDCGYNHPDRNGRLPILEMWIGRSADGRLKIMHNHIKQIRLLARICSN